MDGWIERMGWGRLHDDDVDEEDDERFTKD